MRALLYFAVSVSVVCGTLRATPKAPSFFATRTEFSDGNGTTANIGDFNGDGIGDVALSQSGGFKVFISNGDGTFAPPVATQNLAHCKWQF